ncbi:MAG: hypothetical protein WKF84_24555 [Pyrinomonadaceae bacterium]
MKTKKPPRSSGCTRSPLVMHPLTLRKTATVFAQISRASLSPPRANFWKRSAALGRQLAQLLDTETTVAGVTSGQIRVELRSVAVIRRTDGAGALSPQAGDLELRAGWGHKGKASAVMPGKGRLRTRDYVAAEQAPSNGNSLGDVTTTSFSTTSPAGRTSRRAFGITPSAATKSSKSGFRTASTES